MITARQVPQLPGVVTMICQNKAVGINVEYFSNIRRVTTYSKQDTT